MYLYGFYISTLEQSLATAWLTVAGQYYKSFHFEQVSKHTPRILRDRHFPKTCPVDIAYYNLTELEHVHS